jgi:branched-chain amino acid transport system substrate-binding protein
MRRFVVPLASAAVALALAACGGTSGSSTTTAGGSERASLPKGPILIGMAIARSGFVAPYDVGPAKGAELAVAGINAKGGVLGHPLKLIYGDTKSDRAQGTSTSLSLLAQGAKVMIVTCDFDFGSPQAIAATTKNVVAISPCAGSSNFDVPTLGPLAYSLGTKGATDGANEAQFAFDQGYRKAYLWHDPSIAYVKELCSSFRSAFSAKAGASVIGASTIQQQDNSFDVQIDRLRRSGADFLELCSFNPGAATALRRLRAAGIGIPVVGSASMDGSYWLEAVPKLTNFFFNSYGLMGGNDPRQPVNEFFADYKARFGQLPVTSYALTGYATIELVAKAIETAKTTDGAQLAKALDSLGSHQTIIGPTGFDASHHIVSARPTLFMSIDKGKFEPVAIYQQGRKVEP